MTFCPRKARKARKARKKQTHREIPLGIAPAKVKISVFVLFVPFVDYVMGNGFMQSSADFTVPLDYQKSVLY